MTHKIPLLIDTDPGVDDALALLMAFADERHDVVALTIAAGNVGLQYTVRNALKLCDIVGRTDVPVFAGSPDPLLHPSVDAAHVHGRDGYGDVDLPPPSRQAEAEHAALAILRLSHEHAGELMLVMLGPLTNLALALKLDPTLPERIKRIVVMGGAVTCHGNITPAAEFNIAFDPEAAHVVFTSFKHLLVSDWEATVAHGLPLQDAEKWLQADSDRARFYELISRKTRGRCGGHGLGAEPRRAAAGRVAPAERGAERHVQPRRHHRRLEPPDRPAGQLRSADGLRPAAFRGPGAPGPGCGLTSIDRHRLPRAATGAYNAALDHQPIYGVSP